MKVYFRIAKEGEYLTKLTNSITKLNQLSLTTNFLGLTFPRVGVTEYTNGENPH